ncbi:MAG: hypothetical protein WBA74_21855 [Cyclobacteriaceae bacterium]
MITQEHINQILLIPYIFIGVSLIAGLLTYQRHDKIQRLVFVLVAITAATEILSKILWYRKINNLAVFHIYAVIEFMMIMLIYEKAFKVQEHRFSLFRIGIGSMILFAIFNTLFLQSLYQFNSNVITVSALILTLLSLLYFYKLLKEISHISLERQPIFWINVGILIYFSSSLVFFLASNSLAGQSIKIRGIAWGMHAIFNVFHYIAFSIALWVKPRT